MAFLRSRPALALLAALTCTAAAATPYLVAPGAEAATGPAYGTVWVVDHASDAVMAYAPGANGNVSPVAKIQGTNTGLSNPQAVVTDDVGDVFVSNLGANSITEYAAGASGNVSPTNTISGTATGLNGPYGLSIDESGNLWVANSASNLIEEFGADQSGNVTPYSSIYGAKTNLDSPMALAVRNGMVWVTDAPFGGSSDVEAFAASARGDVAPVVRVVGSKTQLSDPEGIAVDAAGNPWVTNRGSNAVLRFAVVGVTGTDNSAPTTTIAGSKTGLSEPWGIDIDAVGRIVVSNLGSEAVTTFAASARGNTAPSTTVSGTATGLDDPSGVGVLAAPPGPVRDLHARRGNDRVTLSWHAPAITGGGILGYRTVRFKAKRTAFSFSGPIQTTTSRTYRHLKNGHRYYFAVQAVNARGGSAGTALLSVVPASTPGPVRDLKAASRTDALLLTWKPPKSDGGKAITRYRVKYAACRIGAKDCAAPTLTFSGKVHHFTLHDLAAGHRYNVRLTARNALGYGTSVTVTGTPV